MKSITFSHVNTFSLFRPEWILTVSKFALVFLVLSLDFNCYKETPNAFVQNFNSSRSSGNQSATEVTKGEIVTAIKCWCGFVLVNCYIIWQMFMHTERNVIITYDW